MKLIDTFPYQVDIKVNVGISGLNNIFFNMIEEDASSKLIKTDFYVNFNSTILGKDGVKELHRNTISQLQQNVLKPPVVTKDELPDGDYTKWIEERDSFLDYLMDADTLSNYESDLRVDDVPKISLKYHHKSLETPYDVRYFLAVDLSELGLTIKNPNLFSGELNKDGTGIVFVFDMPANKVITNVLNFLEDLDAEGPEEALASFYEFKELMLEYLNKSDETVFSKTLEGLDKSIMNLYYIDKDVDRSEHSGTIVP